MSQAGGGDLYVASLLANFFEAGVSVQVLLGDMDRGQYEASRLARPEIERHLLTMAETARALSAFVRQSMPEVDWQSWEDLGMHLPPRSHTDRRLVWSALSAWLAPTGSALRRYRRQLPSLWQYRFM
jgi:uncharacterized protein with HEPN domain